MGVFDSLFDSPPSSQVQAPQIQQYKPADMMNADYAAWNSIGNLSPSNMYWNLMPQAQGVTSNLVNNPFAGSFMGGAMGASGMGQAGAMNQFGAGSSLYGMAPNLFNAGNTVANTAFDPQNDLYNRTLSQLTDQMRAGQSARGIATTPYGAGLENQGLSNFNIDWNNNQLQRQISGLQGMQGAYGAGSSMIGQGAGLQAGAPGQFYSASSLPFSTFQGIGSGQMNALNSLGQFGANSAAIPQQQFDDYMKYLGWGTGQTNANNTGNLNLFQQQLTQAKDAFSQQAQTWGGIGGLAGSAFGMAGGFPGISSMFGGGGGGQYSTGLPNPNGGGYAVGYT